MKTIAALVLALFAPLSQAQNRAPHEQLAFGIYKELVEINTVTDTGDTARAADAMAARLLAAGYPVEDVHVFKPAPRKGNLVAKLRGTGARKPMILMAHIDVVEARREDWTTDPFQLVEKDGYYYARGSGDDKYMAAAFVANMVRYKKEGYKPDRDIILILETDEETDGAYTHGIGWLLKNQRALIDAEFAINEGGGVGLDKGRPIRVGVQTSEKVYMNFSLEVRDPGGHSSLPGRTNAIYRLAAGLVRLGQLDFPMELNDTTRLYLQRAADFEDPKIGADMKAVAAPNPDPAAVARLSAIPRFNAQIRTTCVATMLEGGHAGNALPQSAKGTVNCRIFPGVQPKDVQAELQAMAGPKVEVTPDPLYIGEPTPASPVRPDVLKAVTEAVQHFHGKDMHVFPVMSTGASDGSFFRAQGIPVYDVDGSWGISPDDERAHGLDERIPVRAMYDDVLHWEMIYKALAG